MPFRVQQQATAIVCNSIAVSTNSVYSNGITLIFDGACVQKRCPCVNSGFWPVGNVDQNVVRTGGLIPAEYGKPQVVANLKVKFPTSPFNRLRLFTRLINFIFPSKSEQMPLVIPIQFAVWRDEKATVHKPFSLQYFAGKTADNSSVFFLTPT